MTSFRHFCCWFYFHPVGNSLVISLTWTVLAIPGLLLFYGVIEPDLKNKLVINYFVGKAGHLELRERTHIALYWFLCVGFIRALAAVWLSSTGYRVNGWSIPAQIWILLMPIALVGDLVFAILYFVDPFSEKLKDTFDKSDNLSAFLMALACIRGIIFWIIDIIALISGFIFIKKSHLKKRTLMNNAGSSLTYSKMGTRSVDGRIISPADYYSMDWRTKYDKRETKSLPAENTSAPRPASQRFQPSLVYRPPTTKATTRPASQNGTPVQKKNVLQRSQSVPAQRGTNSLDSSVRTWTEYSQDTNGGATPKKIPNPPPPPPPPPQQQNSRSKPDTRSNGRPVGNRGPPVPPKPPIRKVLHALITNRGYQNKTESRPTSLPVNKHTDPDHSGRALQRSESVPIPKPDYNVANNSQRNRPTHPKTDY